MALRDTLDTSESEKRMTFHRNKEIYHVYSGTNNEFGFNEKEKKIETCPMKTVGLFQNCTKMNYRRTITIFITNLEMPLIIGRMKIVYSIQ